MLKAQADIISAAIIVIIALSLASAGYFWGMPLIHKKQDVATIERVFSYFNPNNVNSLPKTIEYIANVGGEKTFHADVDGIWILNDSETINNVNYSSITFIFASKASNVAPNTEYPISLTSGVQCINGTSPPNGTIGLDSSSVVCTQAFRTDNMFNITYKVWFRDLYKDPFAASPQGVRIKLVKDPLGVLSSTGKSIRISLLSTKTEEVGSKTLITKEIKILLI
ncbi:MAG: hypothetical protein QXO27_03865 [Candidatus Aenigmatarchaeota archaeon]